MLAYKVELLVIDFDGLGADGIEEAIVNARYANRCIAPEVMSCEGKDIGLWRDEHPLNHPKTCDAEYRRLFGSGE
jgi:hypothetical protein